MRTLRRREIDGSRRVLGAFVERKVLREAARATVRQVRTRRGESDPSGKETVLRDAESLRAFQSWNDSP